MLAKIVLKLKSTTEKKTTINMSSIFQGILMEFLEEKWIEELHI